MGGPDGLVKPWAAAPSHGDESELMKLSDIPYPDQLGSGYAAMIRVGALVAMIAIASGMGPSYDVNQELASAQADCLRAASCSASALSLTTAAAEAMGLASPGPSPTPTAAPPSGTLV